MSILRQLGSAVRARLRREESGFTLTELLVVISISGIIALVLGAAFIASARTSMAASTRLDESRDAKLLNTYWVADGAGASYVSKSALPTGTPAPCAISDIVPGTVPSPGSAVALFAWADAAGVKKNAFYLAQGNTLIRRLCSAGVKVSDVRVIRNLSAASLACQPVNCFGASGTAGMPSSVALTVTESSGYSYAVKVSPRATDMLAANDGPPSVRSIVHAAATTTPSNLSQIQYRVTFSESVTGVSAADFFLSSLPTGATIASVIGVGGGTTYTVVVNTNAMTTGTITLNLRDDDTILDRTNKPLNGPGTANTAGEQFVIDKIKPTVTLVQAAGQADPTVASTIHFTATFSEPVVGFDATKVTLGGTAAGATAAVNPVATNVYDVVVTGLTSEGTVTATIAAGAVTDPAGNLNAASSGADNSVMYDTAVPSVVSINRVGLTPTNSASVSWAVTFSENVTGVNTTDFTLVPGSGLGGAPAVGTVTGSGKTWTVTATTGSGSGTLGLNLVDNDTIVDQAAKKLGGTGTTGATNGSFAPGQVYVIDRTAPAVTLVQKSGQADPANSLPILFTVTFNEAVTNFVDTDVTLGGTAGLGGAIVTVPAGCTLTCDVSVAGASSDGTVTALVPAGVASDAAGNLNSASTGADNSVVYDAALPSVVSVNRVGPTPTKAAGVSWTVIFSENVTGVDKPDFAVASTGLGGTPAVGTVTGAGTTWTVTASTGTGNGTLGLNLTDNGSIVDQANKKLGGTGTTGTFTGQVFTVDRTAPTVAGVVLANGGTLGTADTGDSVVITYSEAMDASSFSSSWVNDGTAQSFNVPVQIDEVDTLADTSSTFLLGSVGLNADYLSNGTGTRQTTFNSTITYDPAAKKLTIALGSVASDSGHRRTGVAVAVPGYSPNVSLTDLAGNAISGSAVNGTSSRF